MKARTRDANEKKIAREKKIVINFSEKALLSKLPIDEKKTTLKMGKNRHRCRKLRTADKIIARVLQWTDLQLSTRREERKCVKMKWLSNGNKV